jgi:ketosteroid isomerase-like protein
MNIPSRDDRPRAIVQRFYDGGAGAEITSFRDTLAEDFEFSVPPQLPWGGRFDKEQYVQLRPRVAAYERPPSTPLTRLIRRLKPKLFWRLP